MKRYKAYLLAMCIIGLASADAQKNWTSKHIKLNKNGSLRYIPDARGNTIPDFSLVGYRQGMPLPTVPVVKTIEPAGDSSQQVIQSAIDEVSAMPLNKNGFRGAIQLKKGIYKIPGTIKISVGGIVLQGEGYRQTKLIATGKGRRSLIEVKGSGNIKEIKGARQKITESYVPVGRKYFTVSSAAAFSPGDSIILFRPGTQQWITGLKMDQIDIRDTGTRQWTAAEYDLYFERIITRIEGNKIFIDNPVVMPLEDQYGGGEIYKYTFNGRISNIGIRSIVCESEYANDTDEDHGWNAIHVNRVENGWIDDITAMYFGYSCVNLGDKTRNITVHNCRSYDAKSKIEGGRRYSFNNDGQLNLIMNCRTSDGRHDFVTGAKVAGPNVFYQCISEKAHADIGPHHRWAMGTLYDNIITDGAINAQDRGNWGTGHGWSGATQIFWNCTAKEAAIQDPWVSGKNYVIGMKAKKKAGRLPGRNATEWETGNNKKLQPASLYEAQLKDRKINPYPSAPSAGTKKYTIRSEEEFNAIASRIQPGDEIIIANGAYQPWALVIATNGTEKQPITIRSQTPGKVIFTGNVLQPIFKLTGSYTTLKGISFTGCSISKAGKQTGMLVEFNNTRQCRLTECIFTNDTAKAQFMPLVIISGNGRDNRVDHCTFSNNIDNQELQVRVTKDDTPQHTLVDHNIFTDKPKVSWKGTNGGECVQVGQDPILLGNIESIALVMQNRFIRCNGEPEVISNKSSGNVYKQNYFEDCDGELVMRGGHRCVIDSNTIKGGNSGIRINGTAHMVTNNTVSHTKTGIRLMYGMARGMMETGFYIAADNCYILDNRLEDVVTGILVGDNKNTDWTGKFDTKRYPSRTMQDVAPQNNTISGNIFIRAQSTIVNQ